jgi:hypothetical protein
MSRLSRDGADSWVCQKDWALTNVIQWCRLTSWSICFPSHSKFLPKCRKLHWQNWQNLTHTYQPECLCHPWPCYSSLPCLLSCLTQSSSSIRTTFWLFARIWARDAALVASQLMPGGYSELLEEWEMYVLCVFVISSREHGRNLELQYLDE